MLCRRIGNLAQNLSRKTKMSFDDRGVGVLRIFPRKKKGKVGEIVESACANGRKMKK